MLKYWTHSFLALAAAATCYAQEALHSLRPENPETNPPVQENTPREKVSRALRAKATSGETVRVFLALTDQMDRRDLAAIKNRYAAQIRSFDEQARVFRGRDRNSAQQQRAAASERDQLIRTQRREIAARAKETYSYQQELIRSRVESLGGKVLERFTASNVIYVEIPGTALATLESEPAIAQVFESGFKHLDSAFTDAVLGAPALWDSGFLGGTQTVAVIDTGIARENPGFGTLEIETHVQVDAGMASKCAAEAHVTSEDHAGHGTHVSGIVAAQGTAEMPELVGVAPGLGRLLMVKVGVDGTGKNDCPELILARYDILKALEYAVVEADHPARVINISLGAFTREDDSLENWVVDKLADDYDVTIVVAAGNSGLEPTLYQLDDFAMSYNAISVANLDPHATLTRTDDSIALSSSSGPTPLGRRKPDIAAPGTQVVSLLPHNESGPMNGTSMTSPHIAGAAALLYDAGVGGAKEVKALLLNTAQGLGWSRRSGWGSADVKAAFLESHAVASATVTGGAARYYRVNVDGTMQSTLVWNRHIASITPDFKSAYGDFRDLNLSIYELDTNRTVAASTSKIDNVEQVAVAGSAAAILKVSHNGSADVDEPYALAFTTLDFAEIQPAALDLQCQGTNEVPATMKVNVSCRIRNRGALPLFGGAAKLNAPAGFSATIPSAAAQALEKINPGATQDFTLEISTPALARGSNLYTVSVVGISFGETIAAKMPMAVNIRAPKPQDCAAVIDPPSGSVTLSPVAQSFVVRLRFPGFDPLEPGLCSWSAFSTGSWYGFSGIRTGSGDADFTITVAAAPLYPLAARTGGMHLSIINTSINSGTSINYSFQQLYRK